MNMQHCKIYIYLKTEQLTLIIPFSEISPGEASLLTIEAPTQTYESLQIPMTRTEDFREMSHVI